MDKLLHFAAGFGIFFTVSFGCPKQDGWWKMAPMIPVVTAAVGKETYDRYNGGNIDPLDVAATIAGGLAAAIVKDQMNKHTKEIEQ